MNVSRRAVAAPVVAVLAFCILIFAEKAVHGLVTMRVLGAGGHSPLTLLLGDRLSFAVVYIACGWVLFWMFSGPGILHLHQTGPNFFLRATVGILAGSLAFTVLWGVGLHITIDGPGTNAPLLNSARGPWWEFTLLLLLSGGATPVLEEVFYRAIVLEFLRESGTSMWPALCVQAALFSAAHAGSGISVAGWMFVMGLIFGILFWRAGLAAAILAHAGYNCEILLHTRFT